MYQTKLLTLAGVVSLATLINSTPVPQTLSAIAQNNTAQSLSTPAQDYSEAKQLARKVAGYLIEWKKTELEDGVVSSICDCEIYYDKLTGQELGKGSAGDLLFYGYAEIMGVRRKPEEVVGIFSQESGITIETEDIQASAEARVFQKKNEYNADLDWNNPRNYLKISWFDNSTSRWIRFTDRSIDGIVDESLNPFMVNREQMYIDYLRKFARLYAQ